jgi:hypothetical protein
MKEERIEKIRLEDGRHGERKVVEEKDCDTGEGVVVTEVWEEAPKVMPLTKRVTEKKRPIVVERTIETIKDEQVVDVQVESLEPKVELQFKEHIVRAGSPLKKDCKCKEFVTEDRVKELLGMQDQATPPPRRLQAVAQQKVKKTASLDGWGVALLVIVGVEMAYLTVNWVIPWFTG